MKMISIKLLWVILCISVLTLNSFSQQSSPAASDFRLTIQNVKLTSETTLEFDLYLFDADPASPLELALVQAGIMVNPEIYNGGTIKASLVEGSSELMEVQRPTNVFFAQDANVIKLPSRTLKPLSKDAPAGPRGTMIAPKLPGTRICSIRLTNSVPFAKTPPKLTFSFNKIPYSTSVSQYVAGVNTPLHCNESNCLVKP